MTTRLRQLAVFYFLTVGLACALAFVPVQTRAAPYAAMVMDARTGEVLHSRNADSRLHPASLTKMMTLYIAFEAIERGEISLDTKVRISKKAAAEPPSKLGLKAGQRIKMRYLIRAAAVKSANDAATAIGEAISGSEAKFARRMNRTAKALGMNRTTFKNAHGLTESGHLSTARDMTLLGRRLFYDHPDYYNLFSRRSTHAGIRQVANTNRRLLAAYKGADGIKTGYTRAAGFNLVASAERGEKRVIATVFGGRSGASRNARVAELLDMGFGRSKSKVAVRKPAPPAYDGTKQPAGKTIRVVRAVAKSPHPRPRPVRTEEPSEDMMMAMIEGIQEAVSEAAEDPIVEVEIEEPETQVATVETPGEPQTTASKFAALSAPAPRARIAVIPQAQGSNDPEPEVVTRLSTKGGRLWGINVGRYTTRHQAERVLLKTALTEMSTLDGALRKVANDPKGWEANFVGMSQEMSKLACRRLSARGVDCKTLGPSS